MLRYSCALALLGILANHVNAEGVFSFGGGQNGLVDAPTASLSDGGFTLSIDPQPAGALLNERGRSGLGINSQGINGAVDSGGAGSSIDFNILGGAPGLNGLGESISFRFDRGGFLTELDFDGVKDESFEFFRLQSTGVDITFFDSMADPQVVSAPGDVVFLQEEVGNQLVDDRSPKLAVPFAAGQTFTLTFGELPDGTAANGARLQSITVDAIPEPTTGLLLQLTLACGLLSRGVHGTRQD